MGSGADVMAQLQQAFQQPQQQDQQSGQWSSPQEQQSSQWSSPQEQQSGQWSSPQQPAHDQQQGSGGRAWDLWNPKGSMGKGMKGETQQPAPKEPDEVDNWAMQMGIVSSIKGSKG